MRCDLNTINFHDLDLIPTQALGGVCMEKLRVGITFLDCLVLPSLLPVGCLLFQCLREARLARENCIFRTSNITLRSFAISNIDIVKLEL